MSAILVDEKIRALLERVALEAERMANEHLELDNIHLHFSAKFQAEVLEHRLLPLLLAGQAMADELRKTHALPQVAEDCKHGDCKARRAWDAALTILAAAQGQPEKESGR